MIVPDPGGQAERVDAVLSALALRVAKLYAHWMTINYRESFGAHARTASCSTTRARCAGSSS